MQEIGSRKSLGRGHGNPLQYSYQKIPWTEEPTGLCTFHGVTKSRTQVRQLSSNLFVVEEKPQSHQVAAPVLHSQQSTRVPFSQVFPGSGRVVKTLPANAGDAGHPGSIPGCGRSAREGNGTPLQYSCLGNPMVGGAW